MHNVAIVLLWLDIFGLKAHIDNTRGHVDKEASKIINVGVSDNASVYVVQNEFRVLIQLQIQMQTGTRQGSLSFQRKFY